jgi:hypothetical protein
MRQCVRHNLLQLEADLLWMMFQTFLRQLDNKMKTAKIIFQLILQISLMIILAVEANAICSINADLSCVDVRPSGQPTFPGISWVVRSPYERAVLFGSKDVQGNGDSCANFASIIKTECGITSPVQYVFRTKSTDSPIVGHIITESINMSKNSDLDESTKKYFNATVGVGVDANLEKETRALLSNEQIVALIGFLDPRSTESSFVINMQCRSGQAGSINSLGCLYDYSCDSGTKLLITKRPMLSADYLCTKSNGLNSVYATLKKINTDRSLSVPDSSTDFVSFENMQMISVNNPALTVLLKNKSSISSNNWYQLRLPASMAMMSGAIAQPLPKAMEGYVPIDVRKVCQIDGRVFAHGESVKTYANVQAACSGQSSIRTCNNGTFSPGYNYITCGAQQACNWRGQIHPHRAVIVAYQAEVSANCDAIKQTRTCNNGIWSGDRSYFTENCRLPPDCIFDGIKMDNGMEVISYIEKDSENCANMKRKQVCKNGQLVGFGKYRNCSNSCKFEGTPNVDVKDGASVTAYREEVSTDCKNAEEIRICKGGALSGKAKYASCRRFNAGDIKGNIDTAVLDPKTGNVKIEGWACAKKSNESIYVYLYVGGPGGKGAFIGVTSANLDSNAEVAKQCEASGKKYRFKFDVLAITAGPLKGQGIYVDGLPPGGNATPIGNGGVLKIPTFTDIKGNIDSAKSVTANVTKLAAPIIKSHPKDIALKSFDSQYLKVTVYASGSFIYQWIKGDVLSSENKNSMDDTVGEYTVSMLVSVAGGTGNDVIGDYKLKVSNSAGTVYSNVAKVRFLPPTITHQPINVSQVKDGSVLLYVGADTDGRLPKYQWYKDNAKISYATESIYKFTMDSDKVGKYKVKVSTDYGEVYSDTVTVDFAKPSEKPIEFVSNPVYIYITKNPESGLKKDAQQVSLSVTATSSYATTESPLSYQWYKDNVAIIGATSDLYTFVMSSDKAGDYKVKVKLTGGKYSGISYDSEVARITLQTHPKITTQPINISNKIYKEATLSVSAIGGGLTYQWYKDMKPIDGATSDTYKFFMGSEKTGSYRVKVSNALGEVYSDTAKVVMLTTPEIKTQPPKGRYGKASEPFSLSVTATSGNGTLSYQWYKDMKPIDGATSDTYNFTLSSETSGFYKVKVSNAAYELYSDDSYAIMERPPIISLQPPVSTEMVQGKSVGLYVSASNSYDKITYQWYKGETAIPGATDNIYVFKLGIDTVGEYKVKVSNGPIPGEVYSDVAYVTMSLGITKHPLSIRAEYNKEAVLSVSAIGNGKLYYQWYKDMKPIDGATSDTYKFFMGSEKTGSYIVKVSNASGELYSDVAKVSMPIYIRSQPKNIKAVYYQYVELRVIAEGTGVLTYQWYRDNIKLEYSTGSSFNVYMTKGLSGEYKVRIRSDDTSVDDVVYSETAVLHCTNCSE